MDIGTRFFHALLANDFKGAQQISKSSTWERIEQWMSLRQGFTDCPIDWWDLDNWFDRVDEGQVGGFSPDIPERAQAAKP